MNQYPITKYKAPAGPEAKEVRVVTVQPPRRRAQSFILQSVIYVSLALFIYVVVRGSAAEVAVFIPFVLAILKLVLGRK